MLSTGRLTTLACKPRHARELHVHAHGGLDAAHRVPVTPQAALSKRGSTFPWSGLAFRHGAAIHFYEPLPLLQRECSCAWTGHVRTQASALTRTHSKFTDAFKKTHHNPVTEQVLCKACVVGPEEQMLTKKQEEIQEEEGQLGGDSKVSPGTRKAKRTSLAQEEFFKHHDGLVHALKGLQQGGFGGGTASSAADVPESTG